MSRFLQVLRWELLLSKRQIATMALTFFGLVVIPQILTLVFKSSSSSAHTMGIISSVALSAYLLCSGALIFSSLRSRQQRINNFMLPASNQEKFIARYIVLVVAMPFAAIAGFAVTAIVIVVLPAALPVTKPAVLTVAVAVAADVNVRLALSRTPVPFLKIPITFKVFVALTAKLKSPPSTAIATRSSYQLPP